MLQASHSPCNLPIFDPILKMSEKASILKLNLPSPATVGPRMKL